MFVRLTEALLHLHPGGEEFLGPHSIKCSSRPDTPMVVGAARFEFIIRIILVMIHLTPVPSLLDENLWCHI